MLLNYNFCKAIHCGREMQLNFELTQEFPMEH